MEPLVIKNALSEETLAFIDELDKNWEKGGFMKKDQTYTYKNVLSKDRRCWWISLKDHKNLLNELEILIKKYNTEHKINLTDKNIDSYLLEYREEDVGVLAEHQDVYVTDKDVRKLSMTVQLNDDFEGGEIYIFGENIPLGKNDAVIFPSFLPHGVNPVIKGNRRVILVWAFGPHWQ